MKLRLCLTALVALFLCSTVLAQKDDLTNSLIKGLGNIGAKKKDKMDYVDFQFAISINENAGFFDIEQKGEVLAKGLYSLKEQSDKTPAENARDSLEFGISLYDARRYEWAEESFREARQIAEENNLQSDIVYLRIISSLGLVDLTQGKTSEAQTYLDQALAQSLSSQGEKSAAYVANLNNEAKLAQSLGKYNEAEKTFNQVLDLTTEVFTNSSMQYAVVLNNKAMLYQAVGRYPEAIQIMKQAIDVASDALKKPLQGSKSFDSRKFQANLAFLYQQAGQLQDAENTFLEIKKVFDNRMQTKNLEYASLLDQMAILYVQMGKKDEVESYLKNAADIYEKKVGDDNPYYAKAIADLGNFYRQEGRYSEAEPLITKALSIREQTLGLNHPDYARSIEDLAILYWKTGRWQEAYDKYKTVMDMTINFINNYFPPMSEAEKTKYWDITAPRFQRFYNFAIDGMSWNKKLAEDMYDYQAATKALLLNTTNKVRKAILGSGDANLIRDYGVWINQKEALARYYSFSQEDLKTQHINLDSMEQATNNMERSLSERSTVFSTGYSTQKVDSRKITDLLTDQEAVVEVIRVRGFDQNFNDEVRYIALVLKKGQDIPNLIALNDGVMLESRYLKYYRNAIQQQLEDDYSYDQFWAPIDPAVKGKKTIYFSPDGVFNQININTLKPKDGNPLVSTYNIVMLGNSKDLIDIKNRKPVVMNKNAVLIGFPDYGTTEVAALPGTKTEIDGVSKILKTAGYNVTTYLQKDASEKNVKNLRSPELVHIATHGYFLKDVEENNGSAFGVNAERAGANPLLRSGLILAGAAEAITGEGAPNLESNDNGVLTAYEAMDLDLEGTELVILSACETGLGDVKSGEGVYGLQRAFLVAGAKALIMSLWKVDDQATQLLMTSFYTNWIKLHDKEKAFKQAQLDLMAKYSQPYYWGAFVMMGE